MSEKQKVVVTDVSIPFISVVILVFKFTLALIPVGIMLMLLQMLFVMLFAAGTAA